MKCIILCAGYIDNNKEDSPKALLKIDNDFTALDLLINQVDVIDEIDTIYVVTNGKNYDIFLNWQKNNDNPKVVIINDNTTSPKAKLGAIGDIKYTLNSENIDDDLLIIAGDAVYDFDLREIYDDYKEKREAIVAVKQTDNALDLKQYGVIHFDKNHKVIEMHEKSLTPVGNYMALALYFYPKKTIRLFDFYLSEGNKTTAPGYFLEYLYSINPVYAHEIKGEYYNLK